MNDWPTDDRTAEDLAGQVEHFARIDAAEAWANEIERLALFKAVNNDGDDPNGAVARHYHRWAA